MALIVSVFLNWVLGMNPASLLTGVVFWALMILGIKHTEK